MKMGKEKEVEDMTILDKRKNNATDGDTDSKASNKSSKQDSEDLGEVQHILNEPDQRASVSASKQPQKVTDDYLSSYGFRFNSSEQFLVDYFLRNKNLGNPLDYCHPMTDVNVYATHPQDLMADKYKQSCEKVWYFFTRSRPTEKQTDTHWILGRKKDIFNDQGVKIGVKQLYTYCENNCKTQYKVVEYQLDPAGEDDLKNGPWFLCKIYKNRAKGEPKKSSGYTESCVFPDPASYDNHHPSMLQELLNELQKERELLERELSSSGQLLMLEKKRELQLMLQKEQVLQLMLQEERELRSSGRLSL